MDESSRPRWLSIPAARNGCGRHNQDTYDRLGRPLTVDVSTDPGASTSYTYSLTSPAWTDPSGSFAATLDAFDRQVVLTDPIHGSSSFSWSYRADGQPASLAAPNGNTTTYAYDDAGAETSRTTTGTGGIARAAYAWTRNQAGQILSEASTISGDPANGIAAYGYDPLGRLAGYAPPTGDPIAYGWDEVPNRTSVQVGTDPAVTTSYDAANRPIADSAGGNYAHDPDGRLMERPGQTLDHDDLGRLTSVYDTSTAETTAYTYDALDRLHTVGVDPVSWTPNSWGVEPQEWESTCRTPSRHTRPSSGLRPCAWPARRATPSARSPAIWASPPNRSGAGSSRPTSTAVTAPA